MKWYKHYENAHTNHFVQALLMEKNGHELYACWFLLLEFLCKEFANDNQEYIISVDQLSRIFHVKYARKSERLLQDLGKFASTFDQHLLNVAHISEKFYEIQTPILSELMGKEFTRTRQARGQPAPKKKNKNKNKREGELPVNHELIGQAVNYLNAKCCRSFACDSAATINALSKIFKSGYGMDDIEAVINFKKNEWGDSEKMESNLKPSVLFRFSNFEKYADEAQEKKARVKKLLGD